jgi:predicted RNA-binding Zn-ribbon protein involved in translation (DUF1610 family)
MGVTFGIAYYRLEPVGWFRVNDGTDEEILYRVSGLSPEDDCIVGFAGIGDNQNKKWFLVWHKSGKRIPVGDVFYNNPTDALQAVADYILRKSETSHQCPKCGQITRTTFDEVLTFVCPFCGAGSQEDI